MKKFLPFLTLLFLVGLIGISTYNLNKKQSAEQELRNSVDDDKKNLHFTSVKIVLPEFSLPDLHNDKLDLSRNDFLGKYSIINFFASWCTTCREEHEILMRLKREGIADMYGVAWHDIDDNTMSYLKKNGDPFIKVAADNRGLFTKITGIEAVPETVIVDPEGVVVMRYRGNLQEFSIDEIAQFIKKHKHR